MNFFYQVIRVVSVTVGAIIGAGFISGREAVSFFGESNYLLPLSICFVLLAGCLYLLFYLGSRNNGLINLNKKAIKTPKLFNCAVLVASFISSASILSGLDKVFVKNAVLSNYPIISVVLLVIISFTSAFGIKGVERVSVIVIPLLITALFFLLLFGEKSWDLSLKKESFINVKPLLYVSMNCFINLPAIVDVSNGKDKKPLIFSAIISSLVIVGLSFMMIGVINQNSTGGRDIPLLYAIGYNGYVIYTLILFFSLVTSLISAYYPLYFAVKSKFKRVGVVLLGVLCFGFSRLGLKNIVDYAYPVIGGFGVVYLINCVIFSVKDLRYKKTSFDDNKNKLFKGESYVKKEKEKGCKTYR